MERINKIFNDLCSLCSHTLLLFQLTIIAARKFMVSKAIFHIVPEPEAEAYIRRQALTFFTGSG
ncbi:hypothetical protein BJX61DRAFT_493610 [Aspergillus egyptiacus]|nr:hypothetical protein BJX61DRAFT_493610 [Aspergillus egyptiacus]